MATAIATAAPTGVLPVGDFGTDAYARFPRDIVLNNTHRSGSPTERVYWYLCHASCCGPHVRTGCYLRNRRGFVQTDDAGREIPVRQKDICSALGIENRSIVQKAIQRLVSQNRLVVGAGGVFYPVMDPDVLAKLRAEEAVPGPDAAPRPKRWMNVPLPDDYWDCPPEVQEQKYAYLKSLKDECDAECARDTSCIRERYKLYLEQQISTGPIIIDEEIEDIRREESSSSALVVEYAQEPETPEPTTTMGSEPPSEPAEPEPPVRVSPAIAAAPVPAKPKDDPQKAEPPIDEPVDDVEYVRGWLYQFVSERGIDAPWAQREPDVGIVRRLLSILRAAQKTVDDLQTFIVALWDAGAQPARNYAWFITCACNEYGVVEVRHARP